MWYTIRKTKPIELILTKREAAEVESGDYGNFLHHLEGRLYYLQHDDEGSWDDDAVGRFLRKAKDRGLLVVEVMGEKGEEDTWFFDYGPGVFAMRDY